MFLSFFLSFFVSLSARLRENGWTDLHEIFREGVERPRDDLITFLVNSEKPRDAQHGGVVCCAFASQLVSVRNSSHCGLSRVGVGGVYWAEVEVTSRQRGNSNDC